MRSLAPRTTPAQPLPCARTNKADQAAPPMFRASRAAACAGVSAGLGAIALQAIGRVSIGELVILWAMLASWLSYWIFEDPKTGAR